MMNWEETTYPTTYYHDGSDAHATHGSEEQWKEYHYPTMMNWEETTYPNTYYHDGSDAHATQDMHMPYMTQTAYMKKGKHSKVAEEQWEETHDPSMKNWEETTYPTTYFNDGSDAHATHVSEEQWKENHYPTMKTWEETTYPTTYHHDGSDAHATHDMYVPYMTQAAYMKKGKHSKVAEEQWEETHVPSTKNWEETTYPTYYNDGSDAYATHVPEGQWEETHDPSMKNWEETTYPTTYHNDGSDAHATHDMNHPMPEAYFQTNLVSSGSFNGAGESMAYMKKGKKKADENEKEMLEADYDYGMPEIYIEESSSDDYDYDEAYLTKSKTEADEIDDLKHAMDTMEEYKDDLKDLMDLLEDHEEHSADIGQGNLRRGGRQYDEDMYAPHMMKMAYMEKGSEDSSSSGESSGSDSSEEARKETKAAPRKASSSDDRD